MVALVSSDWVAERIGRPEFVIIDPRSAMRYLMGHLRGAVSVPLKKLQDAQGRLRPPEQLAAVFGAAGLGDGVTPVLYDGSDGRNAALCAWILEYLGRRDVHLLDWHYDHWRSEGREVLYRPVTPEPRQFTPAVDASVRATLADAANPQGAQLLDTRTAEEYQGAAEMDARPGHIPGAALLPWTELAGRDGRLMAGPEQVQQALDAAGVESGAPMIAYCRSGLRAAVAYQALKQHGCDIRLYDASYAEWMDSGHPVEL